MLIAVDLSATLTQIDFYEVAFGDAKGVGKVPALESSATESSDLTQWLLTVRGSGYPEPIDRSGGERIKCSMECLIARMKSRTADTPLTHIDSCPMYGEDPQKSSMFRRFEA